MEIEINDYCYRFEEMKEAMNQSLENLEKVIKQQYKLMEIVKDAEDSEFDEFLEETKRQVEKLEEQKIQLQHKVDLTIALLDKCKDNTDAAEIVSILSEILGLFKNQ